MKFTMKCIDIQIEAQPIVKTFSPASLYTQSSNLITNRPTFSGSCI